MIGRSRDGSRRMRHGRDMPPTRNFTKFVKARIERDPEFAQALFREISALQDQTGVRLEVCAVADAA